MKIHPCTCILIFLLIIVKNSAAQTEQIKFTPVSGTNGVSLGKINAITRDRHGFIWFSDQSNRCIIRYDGSHMTRYQNDPKNTNSLGGYYPECLFADTSGNIWIGFYGMGLDKFDPLTNSFTHYRHHEDDPESLSNDFVTAIVIDHLGKIWVGDYGGLDLLDEKSGRFKHYSNKSNDPSSLSCNKVRALYEDKTGDLWVGTGFYFDDIDEGGLNRFNRETGTFTRYMNDPKNPQTLMNNKVRAIFEDSYGNFWVGTKGDGLHTMDRKTGLFTRHDYNPVKSPLKSGYDNITFITEDADRKIWIGTLFGGITRYDPLSKKMIHYGSSTDTSGDLKDGTSWCAYAAPDGIVWLSTQQANLFRIDIHNIVIPHFVNKGHQSNSSFVEEGDSVRWYATDSGLLRKDLRNGTTRRYTNEPGNPNSLSNNLVLRIIKDKDNNFWIGTLNGLNYLNPATGKFTRYYYEPDNKAALSNIVSRICEDSDSNIWIGSSHNKGLRMLNRKTGKFIVYMNNPANTNTISADYVSVILETEKPDLWIGTYDNAGLNKMNRLTGNFTHYLPGLVIDCIYKDADGIIWVGTPSGLFQYDRKSDIFNSMDMGNSGNDMMNISSIISDKEDNLWIASSGGIYMLNKKRTQAIRYGRDDGILKADGFYDGSAGRTRDGELLFFYDGGYYAFYPDKLKTVTDKTQLYFTGFWLGNKEIIESLFNTEEIRLNHDQNVFSFSATFIDFRHADSKQILYKLENFDNDWHVSGAEERIQYFKVPPGKYIFHIKTPDTSNGDWIEKTIDILILPPWWNTWWAYSIFFLLLASGTFLFARMQRRRIMYKERVRGRFLELEMQALRAQMNPHFIFNCLSSINHFVLKNETETASDYLTKFSKLIRTVLNNSKKTFISLEEELEMLRLYLDMEKLRFKDGFDYCINVEENVEPSGIFIPPLLFQPFAENAVWHGLMHKNDPGRLLIRLSVENSTLNFVIEDNGVGRCAAAASGSKTAVKEKSMGLQITKDRLSLMNGNAGEKAFFEIEDLYDKEENAAGTRVLMKIKFKEML